MENDPDCCGAYTSNDGRSLCYVREMQLPAQPNKEEAEIERRNKIIEQNLKLGMRLNMPGISEQEQEATWQHFKNRNNL